MKYLLWLFVPILLLGQIKTVTQTGVKRSLIRGDATTLTWTVTGDYSADSLLFIAMDNDSNAVLRLTTSGGLSASYASQKTTINATIYAATTENFISGNYLYDITSVTDSVTLIMGLLSVIADVSNLEDTVLAPVPYYTLPLSPPDYDTTFIMGKNSDSSWNEINATTLRTITGTGGADVTALEDSIDAHRILIDSLFTGIQYPFTAFTDTIDFTSGINFELILSGNTTIYFKNVVEGKAIYIKINNPSTYTVTWADTLIQWIDNATPTMSQNAYDIYGFLYDGTDITGFYKQNFSLSLYNRIYDLDSNSTFEEGATYWADVGSVNFPLLPRIHYQGLIRGSWLTPITSLTLTKRNYWCLKGIVSQSGQVRHLIKDGLLS